MPAKILNRKTTEEKEQAVNHANQLITKSAITQPAQNQDGLPEGWRWVKLGDISEKVESVKRTTQNPKTEFFYLDIGGIDNTRNKILDHKVYTWRDAPSRAQQIVRKNDILFSTVRTYMKNIAIIDKEIYNDQIASSGFCVIRAKRGEADPKYIFYLSLSNIFLQPLNELQTGSSYPAVRDKDVFSQFVPLPPPSEQHAIVSKIEELLSELDKGKQQLETAQQQLKVYRQAVFNLAIKGEATIPIDSIIDSLDQGWSPKCYNESSVDIDEWAVIKTTAIQSGYFLDNENKRLPEDLEPRKQHELKSGDLLITRAGPRVRVGVCCMVRQVRPKLLNCDKVYRMRINSVIAIPEYIELLLNTPRYSKEIEKMKTGISDSGVNLTQKGFLKILLPIPSLKEQHLIVQEIESRLSVCDKLEETITSSLLQAETLRQSILKKAFEGKLISQMEVDNIHSLTNKR